MHRILRLSFVSIALIILLWIPATAQSVLTPDEQEYVNAILVIMQSYSEASTVLATQFTDLGSDVSLLIDAEWRMDTIIGLALYKYAALSTYELSPPPKFAAVHTKLKAIADEALAAVDALSYGMDNIDADSIQKGSNHVIQAGKIMGEATRLIQTITEQQTAESLAPTPAVATLTATPESTTPRITTAKAPINGIVNRNANLRSGPGTTYAIVGGAKTGDQVQIIDQNADGSWLKLADNQWIAAFLVNQGQDPIPTVQDTKPTVAVTPSAIQDTGHTPTAFSTPTAVPTPNEKIAYWGDTGVQTCGNFEWRVSNVRRAKDTWYYNRNQVAQGEYLLVYVEVKNISGGTASFWSTQPTMPGKEIAERASQYAAWMMTGGFNTLWKDDIAPGEFLTLVGAFDVAPDTHTYLFGAIGCKQLVTIGSWFELERGAVKAGN